MELDDSVLMFGIVIISTIVLVVTFAIAVKRHVRQQLDEQLEVFKAFQQRQAIQLQEQMNYLAALHQQQNQAGQGSVPAQPSTPQLDPQVQQLIDKVNKIARQGHENFMIKLGNIR